MFKSHEKFISLLQKLVDSIVVVACWLLAYFIRFHYLPNAQIGLQLEFLKIAPVLIIVTLYSFHRTGLYRSLRFSSRYKEIFSVLRGNTGAVLGLVILLYFFSGERISRLTIVIYAALSSVVLVITRMMVRNFLRSLRAKGKNLRHVLLIGNSPAIVDYVNTARLYKDSGIRFMGWIDSEGLAKNVGVSEIHESFETIKRNKAPDSIIISYVGDKADRSQDFISRHYNDVIPIQLLPDLSYSMIGHQIEDFGGIPLLAVNQPTFNGIELFFKRLFDFIVTLIGVIIISPLLLFIAIGVKISSPGPILFGQKRIGADGEEFTMWKFRSMKVADSQTQTQEWSNKENPRKTKFGEFIRKTSLDELPQLFNVLMGNMSLVGPRPEQPFFVDKFRHEIPGYMLKHKMKPGITGWAQVNGWRGDTDLHKRIECDLFYIKNWSLVLDIKIFFLTFIKGFINKNAY